MKAHPLIVAVVLAAITAPVLADISAEARPKIKYTPIVLTGQRAPDGGTYSFFLHHSFINDADQLVFLANFEFGSEPDAIYLASDGKISPVARKGQAAPGLAPGVTLGVLDMNHHEANSRGQVSFEAVLYGPGMANDGYDWSNWLWSDGKLTNVAQDHAHAPGTPAGVTYSGVNRSTINGLGQVAFYADLVGPSVNDNNNTAFF